jgi:hypothetical protein
MAVKNGIQGDACFFTLEGAKRKVSRHYIIFIIGLIILLVEINHDPSGVVPSWATNEVQMQSSLLRVLAPVLMKTVLPSALGACGAMAAVIWSDGFRAFCGL